MKNLLLDEKNVSISIYFVNNKDKTRLNSSFLKGSVSEQYPMPIIFLLNVIRQTLFIYKLLHLLK